MRHAELYLCGVGSCTCPLAALLNLLGGAWDSEGGWLGWVGGGDPEPLADQRSSSDRYSIAHGGAGGGRRCPLDRSPLITQDGGAGSGSPSDRYSIAHGLPRTGAGGVWIARRPLLDRSRRGQGRAALEPGSLGSPLRRRGPDQRSLTGTRNGGAPVIGLIHDAVLSHPSLVCRAFPHRRPHARSQAYQGQGTGPRTKQDFWGRQAHVPE